jgi:hypothetical protein
VCRAWLHRATGARGLPAPPAQFLTLLSTSVATILATGAWLQVAAPGQLQGGRAIHSRFKRKLAIGTVALAAVAGAGGAYAATHHSAANARQTFLDDVAKRLNVTPAQLSTALKGATLDRLAAAVKSGRLTQAQANALKQRIERKGAAGPLFFGPGPLRRHLFYGAGPEHAGPLAAAATYLGLTSAQLGKQLVSGKSLAQIAKVQGKSTSGLEQAMTAALKKRLDTAVANKRITAAQEQQLLGRLSSRIGDLINGTLPKNGGPGPWLHPGLGHGGFGYGFGGGRSGRLEPPGGGAAAVPGALPGAPAPAGPVA